MNRRPILLLTLDPMVEETMAEALLETGGMICTARTADDAMRIICRTGSELELAIIDFDHGTNGMTLISAINTCANHHLPILVLTPLGEEHGRFVARANGAVECLAKPISAAQMAKAIINCRPKWELALVA
jgi:DNA-binding response OmpR family regulator